MRHPPPPPAEREQCETHVGARLTGLRVKRNGAAQHRTCLFVPSAEMQRGAERGVAHGELGLGLQGAAAQAFHELEVARGVEARLHPDRVQIGKCGVSLGRREGRVFGMARSKLTRASSQRGRQTWMSRRIARPSALSASPLSRRLGRPVASVPVVCGEGAGGE